MSELVDHARRADQLLELRGTLRKLQGTDWPSGAIRFLMACLQNKAGADGNVLDVASADARHALDSGKPGLALHILAAAVELLDPTPPTCEGPR